MPTPALRLVVAILWNWCGPEMRLLHTSDWHIGVNHYRLDRTPDLDHVFKQIKEIARDERVDLILHTGDLWDSANPGAEMLKYAWTVLHDLSSVAPIVVVCGNHDNEKLFELMGLILGDNHRIRFVDRSRLQLRTQSILCLPGSDGEVIRIAALPFIKSATYIDQYLEGDPARATVKYSDNMGSLEHQMGQWLNAGYDPTRDIRIFAAHLLVDGARTSSEYELYIARDFVTNPASIPAVDYAAFGHIHKPQQIVGLEHGRYVGSPIPIDFSEVGDSKRVHIVHGKPGYRLAIEDRILGQRRPMVDICGDLDSIAADREQYRGTIARVFVNLDHPVEQLDTQLREMLADVEICQIRPVYSVRGNGIAVVDEGARSEPSVNELFAAYSADRPALGDSERLGRYFSELYEQAADGPASDPKLRELEEIAET